MEFRLDVIIAVLIAVAGWVITHHLDKKANEKNFLNNIKNDARLEITKAIRDYQDWLSNFNRLKSELTVAQLRLKHNQQVDWLKLTESNTRFLYDKKSFNAWNLLLEEYQILFPKSVTCRVQLQEMLMEIFNYYYKLNSKIQEKFALAYLANRNNDRTKEELIEWLESIQKEVDEFEKVADMQALMEDLRIRLQNFCLGSITGNKVPERIPLDQTLPIIVEDEDGNWIIGNSS